MEKCIHLKCLKRGYRPYYVVRLLKRHGDMERGELERETENLINTLTNLGGCVIVDDSKVRLSPDYDFVIARRDYSHYLHKKCDEYNSKIDDKNDEIRLPRLLETGENIYL